MGPGERLHAGHRRHLHQPPDLRALLRRARVPARRKRAGRRRAERGARLRQRHHPGEHLRRLRVASDRLMRYARWYPTLVTMFDGRVIALSGEQAPGSYATTPERYGAGVWTPLTSAVRQVPLYPRAFVEPKNGRIFFAGQDNPSLYPEPPGHGGWTVGTEPESPPATTGRRSCWTTPWCISVVAAEPTAPEPSHPHGREDRSGQRPHPCGRRSRPWRSASAAQRHHPGRWNGPRHRRERPVRLH